jgi:LDH2 family malate/lactate/ureidoglycolate dehydrogenase
MLSAALQGGSFMKALLGFENGQKAPYHLGHFFMAIDIAAFCPPPEFKKTAGDICRQLRASKKMPGADRIYTAGEKEHLAWLERKDKGVPVNAELQKEVKAVQVELGLKQYKFPF